MQAHPYTRRPVLGTMTHSDSEGKRPRGQPAVLMMPMWMVGPEVSEMHHFLWQEESGPFMREHWTCLIMICFKLNFIIFLGAIYVVK
jgi:hypothetical protein